MRSQTLSASTLSPSKNSIRQQVLIGVLGVHFDRKITEAEPHRVGVRVDAEHSPVFTAQRPQFPAEPAQVGVVDIVTGGSGRAGLKIAHYLEGLSVDFKDAPGVPLVGHVEKAVADRHTFEGGVPVGLAEPSGSRRPVNGQALERFTGGRLLEDPARMFFAQIEGSGAVDADPFNIPW